MLHLSKMWKLIIGGMTNETIFKSCKCCFSYSNGFSGLTITSVFAADTISCGGWFESAYATWNDSNPKGASVAYKLAGSADYTNVDSELIRAYGNTARVDIPGLKGNTDYNLKITSSDGNVIEKTVKLTLLGVMDLHILITQMVLVHIMMMVH